MVISQNPCFVSSRRGPIGPADDKTRKRRALFPGVERFFQKAGKPAVAGMREPAQTQSRNKIQQFRKTGEKIGWHINPSTAGNLAAAQVHGVGLRAMQRGFHGSMGALPGMSLATGRAPATPRIHAPEHVKTERPIP
ncbi:MULTISPECIES: hypothetical protein [unclassified Mesorhizobium]|uniref:hypothetical protein n=1 Tax=unclassified Mesorhizobium TaxID=325217 RepID=UPI000F75A3E5|nr:MULTISPECIES: hypothetical protein [unclassified Mesorhizobium]AZO53762.1 hypothetical protein EJ077_09845 [Mesorhizobium sp. M8A.F.Ca.ET.057.01.1.1]RWE46031.1 MAG: hypothetical protein EOS80_15610 [Mesorhizobium sp.]